MKDPYKVLGVSPNASDDEIKSAYRALARKYHPDKYAGSDLAELAEEKMKEINAAYDEIQQLRANGGGSSQGSARSSGYTDFSGFGTSYDHSGSDTYNEIRRAINGGDIDRAQNLLDSVTHADRGAEWHFLSGCVALRKGFFTDAQRFIGTACRMDPTNEEYRRANDALNSRAAGYGGGYNTSGPDGCGPCEICQGLICADCCCECMGGDFIRCC